MAAKLGTWITFVFQAVSLIVKLLVVTLIVKLFHHQILLEEFLQPAQQIFNL